MSPVTASHPTRRLLGPALLASALLSTGCHGVGPRQLWSDTGPQSSAAPEARSVSSTTVEKSSTTRIRTADVKPAPRAVNSDRTNRSRAIATPGADRSTRPNTAPIILTGAEEETGSPPAAVEPDDTAPTTSALPTPNATDSNATDSNATDPAVTGSAPSEPAPSEPATSEPATTPSAAATATIRNREPPAPPRAAPMISGSAQSTGAALELPEVLGSVEFHYPLLRAIEEERGIAGGRLVSAMGAFDLNLIASTEGQGPATYDNTRSTIGLSQGLMSNGASVFGGYRNGYGDFQTYNLGQKTADGGEFRAGISMPLLRDRTIDRPRTTVQQAQLDLQLAEPIIERQRLDFMRAAARTYWNWVGAGQRLQIAEQLVQLAVARDQQLKARVAAGPTANIERIDNQQNIAQRNGLLVQAERSFQQATIDLSLFLRDETGCPLLANRDRLPEFPAVEPVADAKFDMALQMAFDLRPEPRRLRLQRDKAAVELRLATNQAQPSLNAALVGTQDVGYGSSPLSGPNGLDRSSLNASLTFLLPLQQRDARGRQMQAQAQLRQFDQQLRNVEDVVRAEVQDTFSALERSYEFSRQAQQRVELSRMVASAERELLRQGRSDVLRVTLREQAAFDAELANVTAQQEYFRARADFAAALGMSTNFEAPDVIPAPDIPLEPN